MKFSLTVSSQEAEGFKFNFNAESDKELDLCKALSEALIAKITKIEVSVNNYE